MAAVGLGVAHPPDDGEPAGLPLGGQAGQARVEAPDVVEPVDLLRAVGQPRPGALFVTAGLHQLPHRGGARGR